MTDAALANELPAAGFATLLLLFLLFLIGLRVKWGQDGVAETNNPVRHAGLSMPEQIAVLQAGGVHTPAQPQVTVETVAHAD